jgi:ribosomal protein L32
MQMTNDIKLNSIPSAGGSSKPHVICCGVLERMQLGWMELEDGTRCMPYIKGHSDDNMYRVNNCPSCGKYVRDVMVEP